MRCDSCGWNHDEAPNWAHTLNHNIIMLGKDLEIIMTDQSHLEADVAAENASLDLIEQEIANLKAQPGAAALDFTSLDAATARLKGDEPAPVVAPPADGSQPTDGSAPADGSTPAA